VSPAVEAGGMSAERAQSYKGRCNMKREAFGRLRRVAVVLGCAAALASLPLHAAEPAAQDPPPCTVVTMIYISGAGQCPGGQGSACETQVYIKTAMCQGACPDQEPYCVPFESTWQLVYRKSIYAGDCDPPTDCKLTWELKLYDMLTTACVCSDVEPQ
jgi:hypothetical protein